MNTRLVAHSAVPGFKITFTFTMVYLACIVIIPLSGLFFKTASMTFSKFVTAVTAPRVMQAYKVSFTTAFIASLINLFFGLIVAWVLVRYEFPGKKIFNAIVDLPFALPTAVAGIALTAIYSPTGWIGYFFSLFGIKIAFTPVGIIIALILVGLPFVVRSVQAVLEDMPKEPEEAAASLGASRWNTFHRVILPYITPSLLTGFSMAFARSLGEYGSVIFIAGNVPGFSEIIPLLIVIRLEQYDYQGASAIAVVMLLVSFIILFIINMLQRWSGSRNKNTWL